METVLALTADHTHLYPGARLRMDEDAALPDRPAEAIVLLRDQTTADATLAPAKDGLLLRGEPHTTAAGTRIEAKEWALRTRDDGALSVVRRA